MDSSSGAYKVGTMRSREERGRNANGEDRGFQMPLHYPSYSKSDYENMPEWQLDRLLSEYGLPSSAVAAGDIERKRKFAIGTFLWPPQH
ncbi:hypothetical protein ACJRO7_006228 [Eucalyptus globulus]|uniref:DUF7722 domain-containing protein n=1 Tax=Eucalyptus globulus TaxID=34317 RepID=A0ABD3ILD0_EUCGL